MEQNKEVSYTEQIKEDLKKNDKKNKTILVSLFLAAMIIFALIIHFSPNMTEQERKKVIRFPRDANDLKLIHEVLSSYSEKNFLYVLFGFCYLYIFLQSFAIPGPVFLSILSGALFGAIPGFILVCFCATTGATNCYGLSYTLGRGLVVKYFPSYLEKFNKRIRANESNLLWYMLFLRLTPLIPNWFVNIASPIVGMPVKYFSLGTLFGLMPLNVIHIKTGLSIQNMTQIGANFQNLALIGALAFLSLIPTLFKGKLEKIEAEKLKKFESEQKKSEKKDK